MDLGTSVRTHHELLQYIFRCREMQGFYGCLGKTCACGQKKCLPLRRTAKEIQSFPAFGEGDEYPLDTNDYEVILYLTFPNSVFK
jgi:hypothetical protein